MCVDELAEWMMKAKANNGGVTGLICDQQQTGCWYDCKEHICGEDGFTQKEDVVKWLKSRVKVDR